MNATTEPLHVLVVGAHPDEADMYAGGTAALYSRLGHEVTFLSLTCGDAGHQTMDRIALAARRQGEAEEAARRLGLCAYLIADAHDGELMPSLRTRMRVLRAIRHRRADVVISLHYLSDGHPDHRASGRTTADAVQFATLRNVLPEVPALDRQPLHLLMPDYGSRAVHRADIAVDVGETIEQKLGACDAHATQFYEFAPYGRGFLAEVPADGEGWESRRAYLLRYWGEFMYAQPEMRQALAAWYGSQRAGQVEFAESFQYAPRSGPPSAETVRRLLPMLGAS